MGLLFTKLESFDWCPGFDSTTELSHLVEVGIVRCTAQQRCDLFKISSEYELY